jgi:integrating conjugative element protein (TIGR03757 family)
MPALSHTLLGLTLFGPLLFSGPLQARETLSAEVFTVAGLPVSGKDDSQLKGASIIIYAVDGLQQFETALSEGLPAEVEPAKAEALSRIGALNEVRIAPAKNAAIGLAKAIQYGIDRYPAIVFNGGAVVYGVTDLVDAIARYGVWREAESR